MSQRKPYNPNTKYGRRKLREQAHNNIANYTPEERREYDNIKAIIYLVLFVVCALFFLLMYFINGPQAALKWLTH